MASNWNNKGDAVRRIVKPLLSRLIEEAKPHEGGISFPDFFTPVIVKDILAEHFDFNREVPKLACRNLMSSAIDSVICDGTADVEAIAGVVRRKQSEYLAKPRQIYTVVTSWSIISTFPTQVFRRNDALIAVPRVAERVGDPTQHLSMAGRSTFRDLKMPDNYAFVAIKIEDRDPAGALDRGSRNAEVIRALINYCENKRTYGRISFGGGDKPINAVLPGPTTTIHEADGSIAGNIFQYQVHYSRPHNLYRPPDIGIMLSNVKALEATIALHAYGSELEELFVRYVGSLDHVDPQTALLDLWSVLEALAGIDQAKYDHLVRRVAFLYENHKYEEALLQHVRDFRNRIVHAGQGSSHARQAVYVVKRHVETLLYYHLGNFLKATSMKQFAEFLDLPREHRELSRRRHLFDQALRFRRHRV